MRVVWRLLKTYTRPSWFIYAIGLLGAVVETLLAITIPRISKSVVDTVVAESSGLDDVGAYVLRMCLVLLLIGVVKSVSVFVQIYLIEKVAETVSLRIRRDLYNKVQNMSFAFHDKSRTGELMSRMTSDVDAMRELSGFGIGLFVYNILIMVVAVSWMASYNAVYTVVSLMSLPFLVLTVVRYTTKSGPAFTAIQEQIAKMTSSVQESIAGIRVVKAFAREESEKAKFAAENQLVVEKNLNAAKVNALHHPAMDFFASLGTVFVIWYGGRQYVQGLVTPGDITAFLGYLGMLIWPVRTMAWVISIYQRGIAGAKRVFEIMDTASAVQEKSDAIELETVRGDIQFRDVHYHYGEEEQVLAGLNLDVSAGETLGVLGMTGSGKSTLASLLCRFYDVRLGEVLVDGENVKNLTLRSLRSKIGLVPQDTFLFSASIRENIAYFAPEAPLDSVMSAARTARIHEFIEGLEKGYETVVGERGVGLSGGQRQRVAIARAVLMDPPILILDDATAAVDAETERLIQQSLREISRGRTTVIISQKVSSVRYADRIAVLSEGKVAECGSHSDLYRQDGFYRQLYDAQVSAAGKRAGEEVAG